MKLKKLLAVVLAVPFILGGCSGDEGFISSSTSVAEDWYYQNRAVDVFINADSDITESKTLTLRYGAKLENLGKPERNYSTFKGWFTTRNDVEYLVHDGTNFTEGYDVLTTKNYTITEFQNKELLVSIYAKYTTETIKINLHYDSDVTADTHVDIPYFSYLPELPAGTKTHYLHTNWYTYYNSEKINVGTTTKFAEGMERLSLDSYEINLNKEVNIYAGYDKEMIRVECVLPNNAEVDVFVPYQEMIYHYAKSVTYEGYSISKWSTQPNDTLFEHVYNEPIISSIVLYASEYSKLYYEFVAGDEIVSCGFADQGETVTVPQVPSIAGYSSEGFKDEYGNKVNGTVSINSICTFTATYEYFTGQTTKYGQLNNAHIYTPKAYVNTNNYRNWKDTINFGESYSIKGLKSLGYTGFKLKITTTIHAINDGYQDFFIYSPSKEIYHQGYSLSDDSYLDVSFNYVLNFNDLDNNTYFEVKYAAGGFFNTLFYETGNEWVLMINIAVQINPVK